VIVSYVSFREGSRGSPHGDGLRLEASATAFRLCRNLLESLRFCRPRPPSENRLTEPRFATSKIGHPVYRDTLGPPQTNPPPHQQPNYPRVPRGEEPPTPDPPRTTRALDKTPARKRLSVNLSSGPIRPAGAIQHGKRLHGASPIAQLPNPEPPSARPPKP
jgi:hypothetical protein